MLTALCAGVANAQQSEPSAPPIYEPAVWSAHFESWVNERLVAPQLGAAHASRALMEPSVVLELLAKLVREAVERHHAPLEFPAAFVPALSARGLTGAAHRAAGLWAQGAKRQALQLLREPQQHFDPDAAHLRAQLVDEQTQGAHSLERLGVIASYRFAISLARDHSLTARARVRIAQIFRDLNFVAESLAALRPYLDTGLGPYQIAGRATFADTAVRGRAYDQALRALEPSPAEGRVRGQFSFRGGSG